MGLHPFKGKTIQISLGKQGEEPQPLALESAPVDITNQVHEISKTVAEKVVIVIGAYIFADTIRQVIIKTTPSR